jgi:hypothetical protein
LISINQFISSCVSEPQKVKINTFTVESILDYDYLNKLYNLNYLKLEIYSESLFSIDKFFKITFLGLNF